MLHNQEKNIKILESELSLRDELLFKEKERFNQHQDMVKELLNNLQKQVKEEQN